MPLGVLATVAVLVPIAFGIVATHKWREPVGDPPSAAYRDVTFEASDGLELAGWYRPSENGAAVLVVHGGSSDRKGCCTTPSCSPATAMACWCTTPAAAARATAARTTTAGTGRRTSRARSRSCVSAPTSTWIGIGAVGSSTGADALIEVAAEREDVGRS